MPIAAFNISIRAPTGTGAPPKGKDWIIGNLPLPLTLLRLEKDREEEEEKTDE